MGRHLLTLPLEVRREIYRHVLTRHEPIKPSLATVLPVDPQVLLTCRQIFEEATPVLYSDNRFRIVDLAGFFTDVEGVLTWLFKIGKKNRSLLRHLEMDWAYGVSYLAEMQNETPLDGWQTGLEAAERSGNIRIIEGFEEMRRKLEDGNHDYMARCLDTVAGGFGQLRNLTVILPGHDAIDSHYTGLDWFQSDTFAGVPRIRMAIRRVLTKNPELRVLNIGNTCDFAAVEELVEGTKIGEIRVLWTKTDWTRFAEPGLVAKQEWERKGWVFGENMAFQVPRELDGYHGHPEVGINNHQF